MREPNEPACRLPAIGTSISEPEPLVVSLLRSVVELYDEQTHPKAKLQVSAEEDPSALEKLIEPRSPSRMPRLASISLHALFIGLALFPWTSPVRKRLQPAETVVMLYTPSSMKSVLRLPEKEGRSGGGGGGGKRELTPASSGRLPRAAERQFVPPSPEPPKNPDPKLIVEPTVVAPQLAQMPQINLLDVLGDPSGVPGPPSSGPGTGGGIGSGQGRGVGEGRGPGVGPGEGGGVGGGPFGEGVYKIGGSGVTSPEIIYRVEPKYSEEARRVRYQGTVVFQAIVRKDGTIDILHIVQSLGFGLDENAISALKQWRFRPGTVDGKAVDVALNVEVNFNLR